MVLAEDTRHTRQLFAHFGIRTPLHSFHAHNERQKRELVLRQLRGGAAVAMVSDAGTPAINDPGADLVAAAAAEGLPVVPVPGASAVLAALVASGLPTDSFLYCGFTAAKGGARRRQLAALAAAEFGARGPRGEFVLLVEGSGGGGGGGSEAGGDASSAPAGEAELEAALREALAAGEKPSSAAKRLAAALGVSKRQAYALSLRLAAGAGGGGEDAAAEPE